MRFIMVFEINEKDKNNKMFIDMLENLANGKKEDIDYLVRNVGKYARMKGLVVNGH